MATLMEKDILMEYATIRYLMPSELTDEMEKEIRAMGEIWEGIMNAAPETIDFYETLNAIDNIKKRYRYADQ